MQDIISAYTLSLVILSAFALMGFIAYTFRKKELKNILPIIFSIFVVYLIYRLIGVAGSASYYDLLALDMCIAIIATILAIFYISKPYVFLCLMALLVAGFVIYLTSYPGNMAFAGMFAIGTIMGLLYREFVLAAPKRSDSYAKIKRKNTEINRDIIQIVLGIVLIAVIFLLPHLTAFTIIFVLILLAYLFNNLLANLRLSGIYRRAKDLERKGVTYGQGATYLAASTALIMGFTNNLHLFIFGIAVLFFADSFATIVGISMRRAAQLPYNRYKTIVGSIAFFVVAAIAGYYFIGLYYGLLMAVILAFVEGLNIALDDNIRSGVVIVILGAIFAI
jgi:dolichol kinase